MNRRAFLKLAVTLPLLPKLALARVHALPRYVVAIHVEPHHYAGDVGGQLQRELLYRDFLMLNEMVTLANRQGVKLTLMFSAEAAQFMMLDRSRWSLPRIWAEQGHEIGLHHHPITSDGGDWDGYTDLDPVQAVDLRNFLRGESEDYLGRFDDMIATVESMGVRIKSACMERENGRSESAKMIPYEMASNYGNFGPPTEIKLPDSNPHKGMNKYILVTNKEFLLVSSSKIDSETDSQEASKLLFEMQKLMMSMPSNQLYCMVTHCLSSNRDNIMPQYINLLNFLSQHDPDAEKSRTLSEAIEEGVIPIKQNDIPRFNWSRGLE